MPIVTYVPSFEVVLTRRCAYTCGYCNFTNRPSPLPPSRRTLRRMLRMASRLGINQITLSAGEGIAELPEIYRVCRYYGFSSWHDYLTDVLRTVEKVPGRPLIPVLEVGAVGFVELQKMRTVLPALRLMLDAADETLLFKAAHREAPHKSLEARLRALETAGHLGIPVITGILVGIGEQPASWAQAADAVAKLQERFHHIQQFVVVPFEPAPRTPMELQPPPSADAFLQACHVVKSRLEGIVAVSGEIGSRLELLDLVIEAGVRDLGEIRLGSSERIDTDLAAALDQVATKLAEKGWRLRPRQTLVNGVLRRGILPAPIVELLRRQREYQPKFATPTDSSASAS